MKESFLSRWYMSAVIGTITLALLIVAQQILIPLTVGLFLSLALTPMVDWFIKHRISRLLSIISTFFIALIAIGILASIIGFAVNEFVDRVPSYTNRIAENIEATKTMITDRLPISEEELSRQLSIDTLSSRGLALVGDVVTRTGTITAGLGLTFVITFLLLLYRRRVTKFAEMVSDKNQLDEIETIAHKSFHVLPRYISGLLFVMAIMAILNSIGFWLIGVPSPIFWGMMVALLNVIPYVGPFIGFSAVALFSLAVVGPSTALLAIAMFVLTQIVDNNFLTPVIAGGQIDINPLAAIISIVVWGMIWGVVGMVLALPLLGLIKIICDTIPNLQPIGYLLGSKE